MHMVTFTLGQSRDRLDSAACGWHLHQRGRTSEKAKDNGVIWTPECTLRKQLGSGIHRGRWTARERQLLDRPA